MITDEETVQETVAAAALEAVRAVECPLCGYDQTGALASFRGAESWPMCGRCPECGLDWFWGDLLHPAKQVPGWFAENTKRWAVPVLFGTWRRALRPRRFWREVLVTLPIDRGRLVLFAAVALVLAYLLAGTAAVIMEHFWATRTFLPGWVTTGSQIEELAFAAVWPIDTGNRHDSSRPFGPSAVLALVWFLLMPLPFLLLRDTFMRVRVRRVHLLRIWAYSLAAWLPISLFCGGLVVSAVWVENAIGWGPTGSFQAMLWHSMYFIIRFDWLIVLLSGVWIGWFWSRAIRQYLRLPNARAVVVLMMIASFLAALAIAAYFPGSGLMQQLGSWMVQ